MAWVFENELRDSEKFLDLKGTNETLSGIKKFCVSNIDIVSFLPL